MSDNAEENNLQERDDNEYASLKGKGWEILVGGKDNPFTIGGSDPFDMRGGASATSSSAASSGDQEVEEILAGGLQAPEATEETIPPEAFWDRGRSAAGGEPLTSEQPTGNVLSALGLDEEAETVQPAQPITQAMPPRDLSPEELLLLTEAETTTARPSAISPETPFPTTPSAPVAPAIPGISEGVTITPIEADEAVTTPSTPEPSVGEEASVEPLRPPWEVEPPSAIPSPVTPSTVTPPTLAGGPIVLPTGLEGTGGASWATTFAVPPRFHDPFEESEPHPQPAESEGAELPPDEELEARLITQERIDALWDEINAVYNLVVNDVRGHFNTTEQAIRDLKKARELLLAGTENFDNAEQLVAEVKARLRLEEKVRQWSQTQGTWLAVYLVCWLLLILILVTYLLTNQAQQFIATLIPSWVTDAALSGFFGSLGGVIGALWVLIKHTAKKRDFDPIHTPWYVTNPFMGLALGIVTYLLVWGGGGIITNIVGAGELNLPLASKLVIYALCLVVGFNQNVLWALINRFIKTVLPQEEDEYTAATDTSSSQTDISSSSSSSTEGTRD
jgi:hypothetical protein